MLILVVVAVILTLYISHRASISERKLFSVSLIALFAGILFESFRITRSLKIVFDQFVVSYLLSFICFLPGKREKVYDFESHIEMWPYAFLFIFLLLGAVFYKEKITAQLTEGITLLQSLSIFYWIIDYEFTYTQHWFVKIMLLVALLFSCFSIIHALSYIKLSRKARLYLSIWSSIIMMVFAIDNIISVYRNEDIESTIYISDALYIALQYFLLGISAIYITQNYLLLTAFFPNKHEPYKETLAEAKTDHINRFSENQVYIGHSILCIGYALVIYIFNYKFQVLPRHTMIWLVFFSFPFILRFVMLRKKVPGN